MQIGLLYEYNKEKLEAEQKAGKKVGLGIEPQSLLDQVNIWEIEHEYDMHKVVAKLKYNLMVMLGIIKAEEADKDAQEDRNEQDA